MEKLKEKSIKNKITKEIKKGRMKMKPKIYFIFKGFSFILGLIIVSALCLFLTSFIFFALRATRILSLIGLGLPGLRIVFSSFPWALLSIIIILTFVLEKLFKRFRFAYQRPIICSIMGIVIFLIIGSLFIFETPVHAKLLEWTNQDRLPIIGKLYRAKYLKKPQGVFMGKVIKIEEKNFEVESLEKEKVNVIGSEKQLPGIKKNFKKGDWLIMIGKKQNSHFEALKAKKIKAMKMKMK